MTSVYIILNILSTSLKRPVRKKIFIIFAPSEYLVTFVVRDQVGLVFFSQSLKQTHSNFLMYMNIEVNILKGLLLRQ